MPLQNRVSPFGDLLAVPARGTLFANRGGRFHTDAQTLTAERSFADRFEAAARTANYEILTAIGARVPRVHVSAP